MSLIKLLIDKWRNVKPLAVLDSIKWTALLMKFFLTDDYHKIRHSGTCTILRVLTMFLDHKITYNGTCTILRVMTMSLYHKITYSRTCTILRVLTMSLTKLGTYLVLKRI